MEIGVIFDMDGVIIDSNPYHRQAWEKMCEKYGIELTEEDLEEHVYGQTSKHAISHLFGEDLPEEEYQKYAEEKEALYRELQKEDMELSPGLRDFLNMLKENGVGTAVATSAPRANLDFTLDHLHIRDYFDHLLDIGGVQNGKPDPEIYLKAAQELGLQPGQCIVMEDSVPGVEAGKRAGMKVIGVTTTHTPEELAKTDLAIDDFQSLTLDRLRKLLQGEAVSG